MGGDRWGRWAEVGGAERGMLAEREERHFKTTTKEKHIWKSLSRTKIWKWILGSFNNTSQDYQNKTGSDKTSDYYISCVG